MPKPHTESHGLTSSHCLSGMWMYSPDVPKHPWFLNSFHSLGSFQTQPLWSPWTVALSFSSFLLLIDFGKTCKAQALRNGCVCASVRGLFHGECMIWGFQKISYPMPGNLNPSRIVYTAAETSLFLRLVMLWDFPVDLIPHLYAYSDSSGCVPCLCQSVGCPCLTDQQCTLYLEQKTPILQPLCTAIFDKWIESWSEHQAYLKCFLCNLLPLYTSPSQLQRLKTRHREWTAVGVLLVHIGWCRVEKWWGRSQTLSEAVEQCDGP